MGGPGTPRDGAELDRCYWYTTHCTPTCLYPDPHIQVALTAKANAFLSGPKTAIAGAITIFALGDMIVYNRRKRRDYFAEQSALHKTRLIEAKAAAASGAADEDQVLLINRERAAFEAEKARLAKKGLFRRGKDWLLGGLKTGEEEGAAIEGGWAEVAETTGGVGLETSDVGGAEKTTHVLEGRDGRPLLGRGKGVDSRSEIVRAVDAKRREGERALESQGAGGGPLNGLAANTSSSAPSPPPAQSRGGWTSWVTGR